VAAVSRRNLVPDPQFAFGAARNWVHVYEGAYRHSVTGIWYPSATELAAPCGKLEDFTQRVWNVWSSATAPEPPALIDVVDTTPIGLPENCTRALEWTLTQTDPAISLINDIQVPSLDSCAPEGLIEIEPGVTYSVSLHIGVEDIPGSGDTDLFVLDCYWISGPDDVGTDDVPIDHTPVWQAVRAADLVEGGWARIGVSFTAPPWARYLEVELWDDAATYTVGQKVWTTGIMVEPVDLETATWQNFADDEFARGYDNGGGWVLDSAPGVVPRVWHWDEAEGWAGDTQSIVPGTYGDGDTEGWDWDGAPHRSTSRDASAAAFDWPARYPTQVIGGNGVDVLDAAWEIDRHGGFVGASLEIVPPIGIAQHDVSLLAPTEIRDTNGHLLWEGRVEEPGVVDRGSGKQTVECTGYISALSDLPIVRNYIDTDIGNWETTQCTRFADRFDVEVVDDADTPKLVLKARQGVEIVTGANARAYWYPTNTDGGSTVYHVKFRVSANALDGTLRIALYAADSPGESKTLLWSRTTDCTDLDVDIEHGDIPATTACLIFRIEQVGDDLTYLVFGTGDPETWGLYYGAEISRIKVYGCSETDDVVTPEAVVADIASIVTDADHRDMPDASGTIIGQLAYFEPTSPREVIEDVNATLDWDYGMDDGQVFFFRKPWTAATCPNNQIVVVSNADPCLAGWDLRLDWEECWNHILAYYTKPNGRYGNVSVYDYFGGPIEYPTVRQKFLDLRGVCDSSSEATTIANRVLADSLWPKPTGTVTLKGDCTLGNGYRMPAIYLRPGMMLYNPDLRLEDCGNPQNKGLMLITAVSGRLVERSITLTIGTRDSRLDRILARQELKTKARRK
jgi:hypothetical protein